MKNGLNLGFYSHINIDRRTNRSLMHKNKPHWFLLKLKCAA